ncbi:hypothetical protein IWX92DRAFT_119795 [Phyllosticta citricarpa]
MTCGCAGVDILMISTLLLCVLPRMHIHSRASLLLLLLLMLLLRPFSSQEWHRHHSVLRRPDFFKRARGHEDENQIPETDPACGAVQVRVCQG